MPQFPSDEWLTSFCAEVERLERAEEVAEALAGRYRFVVEPGGPLRRRWVADLSLDPDGDGPLVLPEPDPPERVDARFRLRVRGAFPVWWGLLHDEVDLATAVALRRLRVRGDLGLVTRRARAATPLLDALRAVEVEPPG